MGEKTKIQKFARHAKYFDKYFTVYVYKDPNAAESMMIGPKHIIMIANRDLTTEEIDSRINKFFDLDTTCVRCLRKYYGDNYFRVEIRPDGDVGRVVCGDCDPTIKFAVAYFEAIDPLIAPL
jgi:hypothetical protein